MDRTAVFVDAGYLFARSSDALTGKTQQRHRLLLDERQVILSLSELAKGQAPNSSLLRVYWYDAASAQGPNADHIRLAETDNAKLRLGTINTFGQQKGVDSLIIADLIELARNGAIADAVIVSGDDDLRIGVQIAQTFGVRVHLLGITGSDGEAQSKLLVREADTCARWSYTEVSRFLSIRLVPIGDAADTAIAANADRSEGSEQLYVGGEAMPQAASLSERAVRQIMSELTRSDLDDIATVYAATRKIPYQYDRRLLATARTEFARELNTSESRALRGAFLAAVSRELGSSS